MDKNMKALLGINKVIDSDYEKLYDKLKELELSHNRKTKALLAIRSLFVSEFFGSESRSFACSLGPGTINRIVETIDNALFSNGRINERIKNG